VNDNSTISWMIMGGPRYDEHSQAELDHLRALEEQRLEARLGSSSGWRTRIGSLLKWTARPTTAPTLDCRCAA